MPPGDPANWGYPGGKGGAGVYQNIINRMPPHDVYIETHLGGGAVLRHKRPAACSIGIDIDPGVVRRWRDHTGDYGGEGLELICGDAVRWLTAYSFSGTELVYADPPYLMETRKSGPLYRYEYTRQDHEVLLAVLLRLPCRVMISGYWSELYHRTLTDWRCFSFRAQTRQGTVTEWVWHNFPVPDRLHDYRYLGRDYRERERIARQQRRWRARLDAMPDLERAAMLAALNRSAG